MSAYHVRHLDPCVPLLTTPGRVLSQPVSGVHDVYGVRKEVERGWQREAWLEEVNPQFGTRKLPLYVTVVLINRKTATILRHSLSDQW